MQQQQPSPPPPLVNINASSNSAVSHSVPVSRRNSFSRNASATIDQFRSALNEARQGASPASSPRKTVSYPQLISSNPSSPVRHPTLDLNYEFSPHSSSNSRTTTATTVSAAAAAIANVDVNVADSDDDDDDDDEVHEIDLSVDSLVYSDAGSSSSPSPSSRHSSAANTSKNELQEGRKTRNKSISDDLPDWLREDRLVFAQPPLPTQQLPAVGFSHTAQQIEQDIRHALDSAATRVTRESERRNQFQQELSNAASYPVSADVFQGINTALQFSKLQSLLPPSMAFQQQQSVAPGPLAAPAELLLLMEVVIGEGESETIEVHVGDEPRVLASQFAAKHALKSDAVPKLTQLIQDQLDALNLEELGFFDEEVAPRNTTEQYNTKPELQQQHQSEQYLPPPPPAPTAVQYPPPPPQQQQQQYHQYDEASLASPYHDHHHHHQHEVSNYPPSTEGGGYQDPEANTNAGGYGKQEREHSRAMNYQNLMAKYGHYSQHSGKVNPNAASPSGAGSGHERTAGGGRHGGVAHSSGGNAAAAYSKARDPLTFRNIQLAEHTRVTMPATTASSSSSRRHTLGSNHHHPSSSKKDKHPPAVFDRLYALAESKDKWIRRAQNAKQRELEKEQDQRKVEMAAKSRDLIAHRNSGGYSHIGERLYEEALSDMAKKDRLCEQRAVEREYQIDWMCPKCAFMNQYNDDVCKNIVASVNSSSGTMVGNGSSSFEDSRGRARRESIGGGCFMDTPEVACGQPKPDQLFRPTLLTTSSNVVNALNLNKERSARVASIRRQKNQQAIEDEFRQTCPFKPKINEASEEIVRERLEHDAREASTTITTTTSGGELRRKDPHLALYEDSFHVRANKQAREEKYLRQYSFKPDIGVNSLWINGDRSKEDFVERLAVSKYQELEKKRQVLHEKYAFDRDPNSGREFFKPETGRAPVFNRNERGLPIGEFLHESHREQQEYHRRLLQQSMQELHQKQQQGFVSETSRQALAMRKKKTFSRIFDGLVCVSTPKSLVVGHEPCSFDPQGVEDEATASKTRDISSYSDKSPSPTPAASESKGDVVVTPSLVQLEMLPREIAQVVPIIFEFANHEPFTRDQFGVYMEKLMTEVPGLTYTQVLFLAENLNDGKSSRASLAEKYPSNNGEEGEAEELTFCPVIDKNSSVIAKKHGRADRSKVFQALNQYFEHYKDRKAQIKKQQQREFERTHPFQPKLVTKNRKETSAGFYGKIKRMEQQHQVSSSAAAVGAGGTAGRQAAASGDSPRLHTAIANARPCVRPIDNDASEMVALETRSSSCSSSQFLDQQAGSDEDADLTSRVLAALDELPSSSQLQQASLTSGMLPHSPLLSILSVNDTTSRNVKLLLSQEDSDRVLLRSPESASDPQQDADYIVGASGGSRRYGNEVVISPADDGQVEAVSEQKVSQPHAYMSASEVHPLTTPMSLDPHKPRVQRTRTWDPSHQQQHHHQHQQPVSSHHSRNKSGGSGGGSSKRLVLYALVGEELEPVEEGKSHAPDTNWNAFVLHAPQDSPVRLGDVLRAFPLGDAYHFAFRNEQGVYLDLTNPSAVVPQWDRKIIARVTPLVGAPEVEYIANDKFNQASSAEEEEEEEEEYEHEPVYAEHREHDADEYLEYQSTSEYQEDERHHGEDGFYGASSSGGSNNSSSGYQNQIPNQRDSQRGSGRHHHARHEGGRYDESSSVGDRNSSAASAAAAAKDAQAFLRKQTEQAYDFAKKISMEDAKKGASETAKKAKKWGGSLLSSISASISSAASAVKNETIQVGGITVNVVRPVAEGAYAQVLLVRSAATNETFALKRVICQSEEVEKDVHMELQVFRSVKHLNVMPLVEFAEARQQNLEFYFLVPYFERGSLWDGIEAARNSSSPLWPFTQRVALHLFHGICAGVLAIHRAGFCHRDLKPHNILLSSSSSGEDFLSYIPVVTDFGSCSPIRVEVRSRRNSLDIQDEANRKSSAPYRAPELFEPVVEGVVDGQSDVWSLGCILYAMAFGGNPFEHPREGFMKLAAMNGRVAFPPEQAGAIRNRSAVYSHEFCDFIRDMLHVNPEERPSVLDALEFTEELLHDEMSR